MRQFTIYAPAKLNLYLDVLERRPDGYHNIKTLFEKIDLKDRIIIREKTRGLDVKVEGSRPCPSGKDNIVYKALKALFKEAGTEIGLEVIIEKRIPVSAGLGGGSSDAAAALRSINEQFGLGVSFERLFSIGAEQGKDIPFFMLDAPFARGLGAGEVLEPMDTDFMLWHVVINPDVAISTSKMYKRLDSRNQGLKRSGIEKTVSAIKNKDLSLLEKAYYNIFEEVLDDDYGPYIDRAKALLLKACTGPCFLSGSGPSV
ncbi:MAG: 4-(cytidine 5'-diphospho)-2-C-methyl-D-erythritol kinase, partial [Candidatus Omnitrophota bacterium]